MFGIVNKLTLVVLVLLASTVAASTIYFKYANSKIEILQEDKAKLESSLLNAQMNFNNLQEQVKDLNNNFKILEKNRNDIYNNNKKEKIIFDDHDLSKLTKAKPKLMEARINKAIKKRFDDFEKL